MKLVLKYLLIISALIPATILLILTISLLPDFLSNFSFAKKEVFVLISMILGVLGFTGIAISLIPSFENKWLIKIILLSLGVIGFILFNTITGGKNAWKWILKIEEFEEWIIWVWPTIVSLILILINGRKFIRSQLN